MSLWRAGGRGSLRANITACHHILSHCSMSDIHTDYALMNAATNNITYLCSISQTLYVAHTSHNALTHTHIHNTHTHIHNYSHRYILLPLCLSQDSSLDDQSLRSYLHTMRSRLSPATATATAAPPATAIALTTDSSMGQPLHRAPGSGSGGWEGPDRGTAAALQSDCRNPVPTAAALDKENVRNADLSPRPPSNVCTAFEARGASTSTATALVSASASVVEMAKPGVGSMSGEPSGRTEQLARRRGSFDGRCYSARDDVTDATIPSVQADTDLAVVHTPAGAGGMATVALTPPPTHRTVRSLD